MLYQVSFFKFEFSHNNVTDTFNERIMDVKMELSIYENMKPQLEKVEKENISLKQLLDDIEKKLKVSLEHRDELEKKIKDTTNKDLRIAQLDEQVKELIHCKEQCESAINEENVYIQAIEKMQHDIVMLETYAKELEEKVKNSGELPAKSQRRVSRIAPLSSRAPGGDYVDKLELINAKQNLEYLQFRNFQTKVKESESKLMNTIYNPLFVEEPKNSITKRRYRHALTTLIKEATPINVVDLSNHLLPPKQQLIFSVKTLEQQQKLLDAEIHSISSRSSYHQKHK